jgi:hypothetical protein
LFTTVTAASRLQQGQEIAEATVRIQDGTEERLPLRLGKEMQDWSKDCVGDNNCRAVLTWHKRLAFSGQYSYEGAWADFDAHIFGTRLQLSRLGLVNQITVTYNAPAGQLHLWGLALVLSPKSGISLPVGKR